MAIIYTKRANPQIPVPATNVPKEFADKLGSGLGAPIQFIEKNQWMVKNGVEKVAQNIFILLTTPVGRRLMQPDYGSLIPLMIFEHYTDTLRREMIREVRERVQKTLPYVVVDKVNVEGTQANLVQIDVSYIVKGTIAQNSIELVLQKDDTTVFSARSFTINGRRVF